MITYTVLQNNTTVQVDIMKKFRCKIFLKSNNIIKR